MRENDYEKQILVWQFHQYQLRRKYRNTPAGFQSKQEEQMMREQWMENVKCFRQKQIRKICSCYQAEPQPFVGRNTELSRMERMIKENGTAILYGIGGIGKTALAREYVYRHRNEYQGIIYLTFDGSVKKTICNDVMLNISNLKYHPERYRNISGYFKEKINVLREILKKDSCLMVIDDCNAEQEDDLDMLFGLPCHKIITTRISPESWGYDGIEIVSFQEKEVWEAFCKLYKNGNLSKDEKRELWDYIELTQGHLLSVKLWICHEKEFYHNWEKGRGILQGLSLKKREKELLMYLSIMTSQGISFSLFEKIAQLKEKELHRLEKFLFIQRDKKAEEEWLSLHPLVAEAVKKEYPITVVNGRNLLKGMESYLNGDNPHKKDMWECTYEDNRKLESYVFAMIKAFPEPAPWMATAFDRLATFLWIQGDYEQAEQYELKIYDAVKKYYGENHQITGQMAIRVAAVYYNRMEQEKAGFWYLKGLDSLKKCKPLNREYFLSLIQVFSKISRVYRDEKKYDLAISYIDEALKCYKHILKTVAERDDMLNRRYQLEYPYSILLKAQILFEMQSYDESEKLCDQAIGKFLEVSGDEFRKNEFQELYIKILIQKKNYQLAETYALENMNRALLYRGEAYRDSLRCMEQTADLWMKLNKEAEAIRLYQRILLCLRKEYPYQEQWCREIQEKMNC